jgi:hypothetical protein
MTPFDFLNAINSRSKTNLIKADPDVERHYIPFVINKSLSYFPETVMHANEMNIHHILDKKLQNDYLLNTIRAGKRFAKWHKPEGSEELDLVKQYYRFNDEKARQALSLLSETQLNYIRTILTSGVKDEYNRTTNRGASSKR